MKLQKWAAVAIIYILLELLVALFSYILGHIILQLPLWDVVIVTGLMISATTVGLAIGMMIFFAQRKK